MGLAPYRPVHLRASAANMTKSELVQRLSEANPHLYQRDVEVIVTAIFDEIAAALARGNRVELRGFGAFSSGPPRPGSAAPAGPAKGPKSRKARAVLQDRQAIARPAEPPGPRALT